MAVRKTEGRLPTELGIAPEDLGEVGKLETWQPPLAPDCYLISYLTSPITQGTTNTYVVFVTGEQLQGQVDCYRFEVTEDPPAPLLPSTYQYKVEDKVGIFHYAHPNNYPIIVTLSILDTGGTVIRKMSLHQDVRPPNPIIERLFTHSSIGFDAPDFEWKLDVGGAKETTREVANDFRTYIKGAFDADTNDKKIPMMFLAAMVYLQAFKVPKEVTTGWVPESNFRHPELNNTAKELNGEGGSLFGGNALGVCQIAPPTLAMITLKDNKPLIEWTELPAENDKRGKVRDAIKEKYKGLAQETKIDLFNILRFPKSNIAMCFRLLNVLKNRTRRYPNITTADFLKDDMAIQIIGTEFGIGGTETALNDARPGEYGKKVLPITKSPYLSIIFGGKYELRISGKVVDQTTGDPIPNAQVCLWETLLDITTDNTKGYLLSDNNSRSIDLKNTEKGLAVLQVLRNPIGNPNTTLVKIRKFDPLLPDNECWVIAKSGNKFDARLYSSRREITTINDQIGTTNENGEFSFTVGSFQPYKLQVVKGPDGDNGYFDGQDPISSQLEPNLTPGWFLPPRENIEIRMQPARHIIKESEFLKRLPDWLVYNYSATNPHKYKYPKNKDTAKDYYIGTPGVAPLDAVAQSANNEIDCDTFVQALIVEVWHSKFSAGFNWSLRQHKYAMISEPGFDKFSPAWIYTERLIIVSTNPNPNADLQINLDGIVANVKAGADKKITAKNIYNALNNNASISQRVIPYYESDDHDYVLLRPKQLGSECIFTLLINSPSGSIEITGSVFPAISIDLSGVDALPPAWSVVEGANNGPKHNFFIVDTHPVTKKILTLEANDSNFYNLNGPGFRTMGILGTDSILKWKTTTNPETNYSGDIDIHQVNNKIEPNNDLHWTEKVKVTWDETKTAYPDQDGANPTGIVRLKLCDLQWAGPVL
jgi:hypothetical protein